MSHLLEHSFLFTTEERQLIYHANSDVNTRPVSFVTRIFYPIWIRISTHLLSDLVAPNAITLAGLLSSMQAYQLINTYYHFGDQQHGPHAVLCDVKSSLQAFGLRGAGQVPLAAEKTVVGEMASAYKAGPGAAAKTAKAMGAAAAAAATSAASGQILKPPETDYVDFFHTDRTVQTATVLAILLLVISITCGSLDGVHARRCRSATSLGDIFSRICSSMARVFMALTLLEVFQIEDVCTKWYFLLALQLIELNTVLGRINASNLKKDRVKNVAYVATYCFRESELSFLMVLLLIARWFYPTACRDILGVILAKAQVGYNTLVVATFVSIALLKMKKLYKGIILLCLAARVLPLFYLLPLSQYSLLSVIGDAMIVGLLSIEVYVSHLAQRRIHAAVFFLCLGSLLNDVLSVAGSIMYLIAMLVDLSYSLNVPLFTPVRNVFIDGVFDLCHAGHKKLMANALKFGNRLIVGVCGDEECASYKRPPIMTTEERINEVRLCKYVSEVIPNSPVTGITAEMIRYYNIHVVVCGEEYNTPTDTYYAVPRRMGILRTVPRTPGISTSVLISRIRAASDSSIKAKDRKSDVPTVKDGA
ncbi:cholinephosphate cytidylyltransferase A [Leishmania donovani]|uniref:ethanolamine-phosphate cytidylyltransferase n=3 Tax=Leishmania donovani species complex TaxID=38574 RepID=A0A6L0XHH8_LEIIN|nr:putative cholinephosphate cytidylyltransferase A [Leishmania infantum JPCM5]XP_003860145.1 cholinephosphate cytidylyltransferase A, putative [Leishmania donovani]CAC9481376.1 cholinephosphate_cytidylyltransferase_A_-_putative [Leishmania infantum]AYU78060.1 cholinephosphate cytidylyltransferase A, putative [Leishmania donovani]TPP50574.1 cytidyltransferase-like domain protein [Leishmania donovani]TPP55223.1 cytidyltransferase-like domain protein [Leishmania donovani]CAJ1988077.1 cholinepho|eukprot:XP_001464945.1 putative cholinephosphate cytidylyltransferase A [Leishmania infantum JPCM5]